MKKGFTLLIAVCLASVSIAQVSVPATTKAFYNKKTASWCAPCQDWGVGVDDDIVSAIGNKAVSMKLCASASGNLYHSACASMYNAYDDQGHTGWPNFFVNAFNETEYVSGGGISPTTTKSNCTSAVNSFYSATTADINGGYNVTLTNDSVIVDVTTKFFNAMSGNFYTGVYVLEDHVSHQQNSTASGYIETEIDDVLRASIAGTSAFGTMVGTGSVSAGTLVNGHYSVAINSAWNGENLRVITVVWQDLGGGSYTVINANDVPSAIIGVGINDLSDEQVKISVYPNPANDVINILSPDANNQTITIYNSIGEKVLISSKVVSNSITTVGIASLNEGVYFVEIIDANLNKEVKKFIKY